MFAALFLLMAVGFVASAPSPTPTPTPSPTPSQSTVYNIGMVDYESDSKMFHLTIIPDHPLDTKMLFYSVTARSTGWAGIGFGITNQMSEADFIVWSYDGEMEDQIAGGESEDKPDGDRQQDFNLTRIVVADGWMTAEFWRAVETGDLKQDNTIAETNYIIWAVGPGRIAGDYEQHTHWGGAKWVDKETGEMVTVNNSMNLQDDHAILMFCAWGVLTFVGLSMTKLKFLGHPWFIAHVTIQIVTLVLNLAGFILIEIKISNNFNTHFLDAHQAIGIITFGFSFATPIIGFIAHLKYDPQRDHIPIWPDRVHQGMGYLTIVLGIVSLFLGCDEYGALNSNLWIIIGVWIGVEVLVYLIVFTVEKTQIQAINKESEEKGKDVSGGVKGVLLGLVLLQVLGGFSAIGVFSAYVIDGNHTNIITPYN